MLFDVFQRDHDSSGSLAYLRITEARLEQGVRWYEPSQTGKI